MRKVQVIPSGSRFVFSFLTPLALVRSRGGSLFAPPSVLITDTAQRDASPGAAQTSVWQQRPIDFQHTSRLWTLVCPSEEEKSLRSKLHQFRIFAFVKGFLLAQDKKNKTNQKPLKSHSRNLLLQLWTQLIGWHGYCCHQLDKQTDLEEEKKTINGAVRESWGILTTG